MNHALSDQRNLKFMLSVTKNLFSDMHLTSMIDQMTMQVHHLLKADDCSLFLVDSSVKQFWLAKEETGSSDPNIHKWAFSVGIVGAVAASGETVRISTEAHKDPRFSPLVDQRKGKTTHSILCCPIISESSDGTSRIVGVISVRDEKDRGGFEQEEEKLLKVFCAQAAVAITNSKRFSSIMEQQEFKESDHSAADYLKKNRGMNLADDDIAHFQYKVRPTFAANPSQVQFTSSTAAHLDVRLLFLCVGVIVIADGGYRDEGTRSHSRPSAAGVRVPSNHPFGHVLTLSSLSLLSCCVCACAVLGCHRQRQLRRGVPRSSERADRGREEAARAKPQGRASGRVLVSTHTLLSHITHRHSAHCIKSESDRSYASAD